MVEIDRVSLQSLHDEIKERVEALDRRRRMQPLFDAMAAQVRLITTRVIPELTAAPTAEQARSMKALENLIESGPERLANEKAETAAALSTARRRTLALRRWLEELS